MAFKIAFAGTGYISKVHAQAARNLGLELSAVVNHRPESMADFAQRFGIARQYQTVEGLLAAGGVDALVVSTPNHLHAPQTVAALEAGVAVLVEKPMALDAAQAAAMLATAERSGATLMVGHCWRFDPEVLWLKAQTARLGPILRTKGYGVHVHWGPSGWFTQKRYAGGGALADMGIHALDTARFLLGDPRPVSVYARLGTHYTDFDVDDTGLLVVEWEGGATSYIESGWWQPHADGPEAATQLYGRRGFGRLFPTRLELPDPGGDGPAVDDPGFVFPRAEHCPQSMYDDQLRYFVHCVTRRQTPNPGGAEGLVNLRIIDAALEASRTGQVISLSRGVNA